MAPNCEPSQAARDVRERRRVLVGRLNSVSVRLEGLCLRSDVLRERLEGIEIGPHCPGDCRRCPLITDCEIRTKIIALESSIADLNWSLTQLHGLLGDDATL